MLVNVGRISGTVAGWTTVMVGTFAVVGVVKGVEDGSVVSGRGLRPNIPNRISPKNRKKIARANDTSMLWRASWRATP
jgi:hypothetical protein